MYYTSGFLLEDYKYSCIADLQKAGIMENFQGYFKGAKTFLAPLIVLSAGVNNSTMSSYSMP